MAERRRLGKYAQRRGAPSIAEALASFAPEAAACGAKLGAAPAARALRAGGERRRAARTHGAREKRARFCGTRGKSAASARGHEKAAGENFPPPRVLRSFA